MKKPQRNCKETAKKPQRKTLDRLEMIKSDKKSIIIGYRSSDDKN